MRGRPDRVSPDVLESVARPFAARSRLTAPDIAAMRGQEVDPLDLQLGVFEAPPSPGLRHLIAPLKIIERRLGIFDHRRLKTVPAIQLTAFECPIGCLHKASHDSPYPIHARREQRRCDQRLKFLIP